MRAGFRRNDDGLTKVRGGGRSLTKLGREFAKDKMLAALLNEAKCGDVPEHGRAAIAHDNFPAVGQVK